MNPFASREGRIDPKVHHFSLFPRESDFQGLFGGSRHLGRITFHPFGLPRTEQERNTSSDFLRSQQEVSMFDLVSDVTLVTSVCFRLKGRVRASPAKRAGEGRGAPPTQEKRQTKPRSGANMAEDQQGGRKSGKQTRKLQTGRGRDRAQKQPT